MILSLLYKLALISLGFNLVLLIRFLVHSLYIKRSFRHVPGPPPSSLLWGEEWELYNGVPGEPYVHWHNRFGKLVKFRGAFGHQVISITDPRAIAFILGDGAYQFPKPQGVRAWFKATLGEGILWVEGKKAHERQRRIIAPALNQQSIRRLTDIFFEKSIYLANQWNKLYGFEDGQREIEIEVTNWAGRFALETIGRAAFYYDFNCLSGGSHELASALDGLTNNEHRRSSFYMRALFWLVPSILSIGEKGKMIKGVKQQLGAISLKMWRDAKRAGDTDNRTLMANILKYDQLSAEPMDEEQIVSQMRTVISAGYETVSAIVAWMLYEIATHPDFQAQLREEICLVPDHSFDSLNNQLPLLDAALKETLRLHPAILENHHEASDTTSIPLSKPLPDTSETALVIPKGTIVVIPVNVLQMDPEFWGKDSASFRPQRWLEDNRADPLKGRDLLAFSMGPRSCIGRNFAMTEIKCLMVTLLRKYSFRCKREIESFQSFVIRPRVSGESASSLPLLVKKLG